VAARKASRAVAILTAPYTMALEGTYIKTTSDYPIKKLKKQLRNNSQDCSFSGMLGPS